MKLNGKRSGFFLTEAIVSLLVTALTLTILQQSLNLFGLIIDRNDHANIRVHVVEDRLQSYLTDKTIFLSSKNSHKLMVNDAVNPDGSTHYKAFELYKNYLRLEDSRGGFEPILGDVEQIDFKRLDNILIIQLLRVDQKRTEMIFEHVHWKS